MQKVAIIGAGLAGCEAAWQLAEQNISVLLLEMKPNHFSPAHKSNKLAELVCSNSFRSKLETSAPGILKRELLQADSIIMRAAMEAAVPAGKALAVDREKFSTIISNKIMEHPMITIEKKLVSDIPKNTFTIIAAGPLCHDSLVKTIQTLTNIEDLYFFDAISPIINADSIDFTKIFRANRWDNDSSGDYLNIPLNKTQYLTFVNLLKNASTLEEKNFEKKIHFEACLPIEEMAQRGEMTLAFGPMKPAGLIDPNTGKRPFAVVQLRKENEQETAFNMVGFQTRQNYNEQKKIFRTLPGLEKAEFERLGSIHRNTYINSPKLLNKFCALQSYPNIYFAGQITGVEGYIESAASGFFTGLNLAHRILNKNFELPPEETALGALIRKLQREEKKFIPTNINFSLFAPLGEKKYSSKEKKENYSKRAELYFTKWLLKLNEKS